MLASVEKSYKGGEFLLVLVVIFLKTAFWCVTSEMQNLMPEFQPYKERIPEFVIKLYHILERKEYQEFMTWNGNSQILIKQPKKLEDKVLPHFFRHKHLSSFIRQLNMYRFSKVIKLVKERNYMYFRNQHFRRDDIKGLMKIKRNVKKTKTDTLQPQQSQQKSDNISIDQQLKNTQLTRYKQHVRSTVQQIVAALKRLEGHFPDLKEALLPSLTRCNQLLEVQQAQNHSFLNLNLSESDLNQGKNPMSEKMMHVFEPVLFPSQNYFD